MELERMLITIWSNARIISLQAQLLQS